MFVWGKFDTFEVLCEDVKMTETTEARLVENTATSTICTRNYLGTILMYYSAYT